MKNSLLVLSLFSFILGTSLTSCNTPAEKVENAKADVKDANKNLVDANAAYAADMTSYKQETSDKIAANQKSIADFKARINNQKKDAKAEYEKQIDALEVKNTDMQKKMDDYKMSGKEQWETFKTEFNHDMDELGKSFKNFTVKNVK